ncbi:MAG: hypothetical protein A2Y76_04645 [Planctomycetes bacterium RBG_13_60_9]|nr:MAG: hypothetical protein A2Y76_04645 [Planctomycetes bacterium RBG_13_60_9]
MDSRILDQLEEAYYGEEVALGQGASPAGRTKGWGCNGLEATRRILKTVPVTRMLILSAVFCVATRRCDFPGF